MTLSDLDYYPFRCLDCGFKLSGSSVAVDEAGNYTHAPTDPWDPKSEHCGGVVVSRKCTKVV